MTLDKSLFSKHMPLCMKDCKVIQKAFVYGVQEFLDAVVGGVKSG